MKLGDIALQTTTIAVVHGTPLSEASEEDLWDAVEEALFELDNPQLFHI